MRLRLTPQDATFVNLLTDAAANAVAAAELLAELIGSDPPQRPGLAEKLRDAEHRGDEITHTIMRRLNVTFVTPFDREDIYSLASALDDCVDYLEEAGDLFVLYRIPDLPPASCEQVAVLLRQARCTAEAMQRLRTLADLPSYWEEINRLENEADRIYRGLLGELFEQATDPVALLKVKEVAGALEAAADAFERVSNHVETIAVKES